MAAMGSAVKTRYITWLTGMVASSNPDVIVVTPAVVVITSIVVGVVLLIKLSANLRDMAGSVAGSASRVTSILVIVIALAVTCSIQNSESVSKYIFGSGIEKE